MLIPLILQSHTTESSLEGGAKSVVESSCFREIPKFLKRMKLIRLSCTMLSGFRDVPSPQQ